MSATAPTLAIRGKRGTSEHTTAIPPVIIEVRNLKILRTGTALKATCSVRYAGTTVDECKIVWPEGKDAPFISPPQLVNEYQGRRTYTTIIRWSKELAAAITATVLDAYYEATGTKPYDPFAFDEEA